MFSKYLGIRELFSKRRKIYKTQFDSFRGYCSCNAIFDFSGGFVIISVLNTF